MNRPDVEWFRGPSIKAAILVLATRTIAFFLRPDSPAQLAIDVAGPDRLSLPGCVALYRDWLGWPPARQFPVPRPLANLAYLWGDGLGRLGWRPPVNSTAAAEMKRGATGDPSIWIAATGIVPRPLFSVLDSRPATVQDRWFARLWLVRPIMLAVLALFWLGTGLISLTAGFEIGRNYLLMGDMGWLASPSVLAGGLADLVIGLGIALRRWSRLALWSGIGLSLFYAVAGTLVLPVLWIDPLGPMLKIWPVIALHLAALAVLEPR